VVYCKREVEIYGEVRLGNRIYMDLNRSGHQTVRLSGSFIKDRQVNKQFRDKKFSTVLPLY